MSNDFLSPHDDADEAADFDLSPEAQAELDALLGDPSMWDPVDPADEAAILAAIGELRDTAPTPVIDLPTPEPAEVPSTSEVAAESAPIADVVPISRARRWVGPFVAGVAAALVLSIGAVGVFGGDDGPTRPDGIELALDSTDLAPEGDGVVEIITSANGTVLLLDVSGLPPAPEGTYYEAWLRQDAEVGVSAGTFHLRGAGASGDTASIELWAGVTIEDYPLFTITIQDEAEPTSSGQVVLRGLVEN